MFRPKLFTLIKNCPSEFTFSSIMKEVKAGLVVAFIALPLSIALAIACGVGPERGLVTAVIGGFLISFFGGSRVQIGGPTGAFVVIVLGIVSQYGQSGLILATFMAGIFLIIMGLIKFGNVIKYIPYPVTTGFTAGIAVTLFSTQINEFLGLNLNAIPSDFFDKWLLYFHSFNFIDLETLLIGLLALAIIIFWPKKFNIIPGTLVAIFVTTTIVYFFNLNIDTIHSRFGDIRHSFPLPDFSIINFTMMKDLIFPSFIIALLAGIESLLCAVVADGMISKRHRSNMELIAQGVANSASALFGGVPAAGAIARTTANIENGGRTPIAGMSHAIFILIMMLTLMSFINLIPMATLSAILFMVAYRMSEWRSFASLFRAPVSDIIVLFVTFSLTVVKDLVVAIEVGMVLAAFLFMKRMADVSKVTTSFNEEDDEDGLHVRPDIDECLKSKEISVYKIDGPFFFGAATSFLDSFSGLKDSHVLILRMRNVPAMDATGYHALMKIYKRCLDTNTRLFFAAIQKQPYKVLFKYGLIDLVGKENFFSSTESALIEASKIVETKKDITKETKLF